MSKANEIWMGYEKKKTKPKQQLFVLIFGSIPLLCLSMHAIQSGWVGVVVKFLYGPPPPGSKAGL